MQGRLLIVRNAAQFLSHNPRKDSVHTVNDFPSAPEILMQVYPSGVFCAAPVNLLFFQKQLRPCQTEFINALLHIPHHKAVVPSLGLPADAGKQILLHQIAVLILVYHNFMEPASVSERSLRGHIAVSLPAQKRLQGKMLNIVKVKNIFFPLGPVESLLKSKRQIHKRSQSSLAGFHLPAHLPGRPAEELCPQLGDCLLHAVPERFRRLTLCRLDRSVPLGWQSAKNHRRKSGTETVVIGSIHRSGIFLHAAAQTQQTLHHFPLCLQQLPIKIRPVRFLTQPDRFLQPVRTAFQHKPHMIHEQSRPRKTQGIAESLVPPFVRLLKSRRPADMSRLSWHIEPVILLPFRKPLFRERHTHGKIIEFQRLLFHRVIPAAHAEIFHTVQESRIFFRVSVLYHVRQHICPQKFKFPFLRNPKTGIQADGVKLVSQNEKAETVYGRDLGIIQQCGLPLQMLVAGIQGQPVVQGTADPLPHLGSRRIGKSHHQQSVDIHRVLPIADHLHDPFHQNRRLAGSRRRSNKKITVPYLYDLSLCFCKCDFHVSSRILSNASSAFNFASFLG